MTSPSSSEPNLVEIEGQEIGGGLNILIAGMLATVDLKVAPTTPALVQQGAVPEASWAQLVGELNMMLAKLSQRLRWYQRLCAAWIVVSVLALFWMVWVIDPSNNGGWDSRDVTWDESSRRIWIQIVIGLPVLVGIIFSRCMLKKTVSQAVDGMREACDKAGEASGGQVTYTVARDTERGTGCFFVCIPVNFRRYFVFIQLSQENEPRIGPQVEVMAGPADECMNEV